jgi:division protein CdvB (Snf7/Vps24/ESCRT-III family)
MEAGETTGSQYEIDASGAEAQRIMTEASTIAEQHMKERFPDLPAGGLTTPQRTGELNSSQ